MGTSLPRPLGIRWPVEFMLHAEEEKAIFSFKKISYEFHTVIFIMPSWYCKKFSVLAKCDCRQIWKISYFKHHLNLVIEHFVCAKSPGPLLRSQDSDQEDWSEAFSLCRVVALLFLLLLSFPLLIKEVQLYSGYLGMGCRWLPAKLSW